MVVVDVKAAVAQGLGRTTYRAYSTLSIKQFLAHRNRKVVTILQASTKRLGAILSPIRGPPLRIVRIGTRFAHAHPHARAVAARVKVLKHLCDPTPWTSLESAVTFGGNSHLSSR
jgi:hypothetical protein